MGSMFEQIDVLPCAKRQPAAHHRNGKMRLRKRGADVRRHVVRSFHGVAIAGITLRRDPLEEVAQVRDNVGIGVFLNGERGGCMLAKERQESCRKAALRDPVDDGRGEVVKTLALRCDFEAGGELFHVYF